MSQEIIKRQETWNITYDHSMGETGSHFFNQIKNNQKLMGKYCPSCDRVLMPPRKFCDRCFVPTTDWVEVGSEGVIEAATLINAQFKNYPAPPYSLAYVRLDKADTSIGNYLKGLDFSNHAKAVEQIKIGNRVKLKFREERDGSILDFWFEVV